MAPVPSALTTLALAAFELGKWVFPDVLVHVKMRDSRQKTRIYTPSGGVVTHSIPRRATTLFRLQSLHLIYRGSTLPLGKSGKTSLTRCFVRNGTIVDATIIHAPTSTKNESKQRDPEMKSAKKGNQWYFGMKCHVGVDAESGVVHTAFT